MFKRLSENHWIFSIDQQSDIIDFKEATPEEYFLLYANGLHYKLFENFNRKTDVIEYYDTFGRTRPFLVHKRYSQGQEALLAPGFYTLFSEDYKIHLMRSEPQSEEYLDINDQGRILQKDVDDFFNNNDLYKSMNMSYKRAALLFGNPGSGKTLTINNITKKFLLDDSLILFIKSDIQDLSILKKMQASFKNRKTLIILEEFTNRIQEGYLAELLTFFDGQQSAENIYIIATTNYPDLIPANFLDRPGRFDLVLEFKEPSIEARKIYLEKYLDRKITDEELLSTHNLSYSYLKEIVIQCKINNLTIKEALNKIKIGREKFSQSFKSKMGMKT